MAADPMGFVGRSLFHADGSEPAKSFESARAFVSPFFDLRPTDPTFGDARASCVSYRVDTVVFELCSFGPMALARGPARRADPMRDNATLWFIRAGEQHGLVEEEGFRSRPGEVHLIDTRRALHFHATRRDILTLHLPYAAIGYDPGRHPPHLRLPADAPATRVLAASLHEAFSTLPRLRAAEAPPLARTVAALVRGLFGLASSEETARSALDAGRKRAMRAWLDGRLRDPAVDTESLCRAFAVSRTTVYRLFADQGGVAAYLRNRRLDAIYAELAVTPAARGRVRAAAERWGYHDPSHFNRLFRTRFGIAPSDVPPSAVPAATATRRGAVARPAEPNLVPGWLLGG